MYPRSINQILEDAMEKALTKCNELRDKKKKYLKRVRNRQRLKRKK